MSFGDLVRLLAVIALGSMAVALASLQGDVRKAPRCRWVTFYQSFTGAFHVSLLVFFACMVAQGSDQWCAGLVLCVASSMLRRKQLLTAMKSGYDGWITLDLLQGDANKLEVFLTSRKQLYMAVTDNLTGFILTIATLWGVWRSNLWLSVWMLIPIYFWIYAHILYAGFKLEDHSD